MSERFSHISGASQDLSDYYALKDEILSTMDDDARYELTKQYVEKFYEDWCFFIPFRQDEYATLVSANLEGFERVGDSLKIEGVYFTK